MAAPLPDRVICGVVAGVALSLAAFVAAVRECGRLARSWWRVDRIRVSPREGRLLRLQPPCDLLIRGRTTRVVSRSVAGDARGLAVVYECEGGDDGPGRLEVRCGLSASERTLPGRIVWWQDGRGRRALDKDEVLALGNDEQRRRT